ncbi:tetratricopeptide repeat protein [Erythrobacter sp. BLCC-B19]|uniref:tetratricopeptide repeat protein n=1 Tax=Erythrobacter sp. BLCC-B19 TaxID=3025315 RepID=UPI00235E0A78|nr:tetratricopeptide repeat protein [Erythrobacter sp. BLCC-B19]WDA42831.1 tetratricopeptide repeat protein [Erythrobacter sp. BLCC-B19]
MGLSIDEQKAVDRFRKAVVEPSQSKLVILDFWAEWCGPCKALTPVLEKVAGEYADKGVVLAKINVDEEQFIAAQFQVRSIPTVYAMFQGQPIADLTNARSESQLKAILDQLLGQLPVQAGAVDGAGAPQGPSPEELAQFVKLGEEALAAGDAQRAAGIFAQITEFAEGNAPAHAGLVRALVMLGEVDQARQVMEVIDSDPRLATDPAIAPARAALELAGERVDDGELAALRAAAAADPANMDAQLAFAEAAFAAGARDEAADTLLAMIAADREWNEGAARTKLLKIFEATGLEDEWVVSVRRRLSRVLFG